MSGRNDRIERCNTAVIHRARQIYLARWYRLAGASAVLHLVEIGSALVVGREVGHDLRALVHRKVLGFHPCLELCQLHQVLLRSHTSWCIFAFGLQNFHA